MDRLTTSEDAQQSKGPAGSWVRRWVLRLVVLAVACFALGNAALWGVSLYMDAELPAIRSIEDYRALLPKTTEVFAADGSPMGTFFQQRRTFVPAAAIPKHVKLAAVAAEDGDFYSHEGLDWFGMARALYVNVRAGGFRQGASTITQQLARALHLGQHKTLWRKFREAFLARKLDKALSKDDILLLYLNQIYFGRGRYGIEQAARLYLGKSVGDLDIAEAALLMAIVPSPERLNPHVNLKRLVERRNLVLVRMEHHGFIDSVQHFAARQQWPRILPPPAKSNVKTSPGRWYLDVVRRRLESIFGTEVLRGGGLRVYTAMRPKVQSRLEAAVLVARLPKQATAAGVFVDLRTREVTALVGGRDDRRDHFNRAVQAHRQAGSTFKAFVYGAGIEAGIFDDETRLPNKRLRFGRGKGAWRPKNADGVYDGALVSMPEALARSLNVVAVQALRKVGVAAVVDYARRAGFTAHMSANLTLALGNVSVTPLELANAYATLGTGGVAGEPVFIRRVEDAQGNVLYAERPNHRVALEKKSATMMARWLTAVVERGTGKRARIPGQVVAGKTGTTDDAVDAWFVGFTGDVAGAVWVGRDDARSMGRASGGSLAAPLWRRVMQEPIVESSAPSPGTGAL